ncbi:MAG: WXG100 family type VII secretion target [Clostridiaceae bacterium]|nr:WXG100 family type VII secretion target [Clostridiaceae bacterium]
MLIRIDYNQVIRQANEIGSIAGDLDGVKKELQNIISDVDVNWDGEASKVYVKRCTSLGEYIKDVSRDMNRVSSTIKEVARIIKQADERANELASKLRDSR